MNKNKLDELITTSLVGTDRKAQATSAASQEMLRSLLSQSAAGGNGSAEIPYSTTATPQESISEHGGGKQVTEGLVRLTAQLDQLRLVALAQVDTLQENTSAVLYSSETKSGSTISSATKTIGQFFTKTLTSGLGLSPLISSAFGLFGRDKNEEPPALVPFSLPSAVQVDSGITASGQMASVMYGQDGLPRPALNKTSSQQINIQVQAIDSRSFLDHSEEIARAVKDAMLHSHSINDVVADL